MRFSTVLLPLFLSLTTTSTPISSVAAAPAFPPTVDTPLHNFDTLLTPTTTTPEHLAAIHASLSATERLTIANSTFHTFLVNSTLIPETSRGLQEITAECVYGDKKRVDAGDAYMAGLWLSKRDRDCTQVEAFATQMARRKWARLYMVGPRGWTEPCFFMGHTAMKLVDHCAVDKDNSVLGTARFWYAGSGGSSKMLRVVKGSRSA